MPQEVQNCHSLVQVTSEVSDTPLSQPLTTPHTYIHTYVHTYIRTYVPLRLPLYVSGGVYIFVPINVSTALYECSFISESFLQSNDLVSIAANRTIQVWFRTLAIDDNTVMYAVHFICTQSCIHMILHIL